MASIPVELAAALDTRLLASGRAIVDARARAVIAVLDASAATEAVAAITRFAAEHKRCPDSITSGIARFLFALLWHGATTHWVDSGVAKKLVAAHVDVLNRLTHPKFIRSCSHTVAQLLTKNRSWMPLYADLVLKEQQASFVALCALLRFAPFLPEHKAAVLQIYLNDVVGAKTKPPATIYADGFAPLFAALTPSDMTEAVVPVLDRWLKRSQGPTLHIASALLSGMTIDIDSYLALLLRPLCAGLRIQDRHDVCSRTIALFAQRARSPSVLIDIAKEIDAHLSGARDGAVSSVHERIALAVSLKTLYTSPHARNAAPAIANILFEQAKRETNEDGRLEVLDTLACFVSLVDNADAIASWTESSFLKQVESKPEIVTGYLVVLSSVAQWHPGKCGSAVLRSCLLKLVGDACSKSHLRSPGLAALAVLVHLDIAPPDTSFAWAPSSIQGQSERDGVILCSIVSRILGRGPDAAQKFPALFPASVCLMAVRDMRSVSSAAFSAVQDASWAKPHFIDAMFDMLYHDEREAPIPLHMLSPFALSAALRRAVQGTADPSLSRDLVLRIALLAHHPLLIASNRSQRRSTLWTYIRRVLSPAISFTDIFNQYADNLSELMVSPRCLLSADDNAFEGAVATTESVATLASTGCGAIGAILQRMSSVIGSGEISSITPTDLVIYSVPDGRVARVDDATDGSSKPKPRTSQKKSLTDEEWAAKVQAEIEERRRAETEGSDNAERNLAAEIERQDGIRARLRSVLQPYIRVLQGLRLLCTRMELPQLVSHRVLSEQHSALLEGVWALARFSPLAVSVRQTLSALGANGGLDPRLRKSSDLIAFAVAAAAEVGPDVALPTSPLRKTVDDAVLALSSSPDLFDGATIRFIMPLLEAMLLSSPPSKPCISILSRHAHQDNIPVDRILNLVLQLVNGAHSADYSAPLVVHGISGRLSRSKHLQPLLGDLGILSKSSYARQIALDALGRSSLLESPQSLTTTSLLFMLTRNPFATDEENRADVKLQHDAQRLWSQFEFAFDPEVVQELSPLMSHPVEWVRECAGVAVGHALTLCPSNDRDMHLRALIDTIRDNPDQWVQSQFDLEPREIDRSATRAAVYQALGAAASVFTPSQTVDVIRFMVEEGLSDSKRPVWDRCLKAGLAAVESECGAATVSELQEILDAGLKRDSDLVREGSIVLLGRIAQYLNPDTDEDQILSVFERLLEALRTPSYSVQMAVAQCLAPLSAMLKRESQRQDTVNLLLDRLSHGETYGDRKGAALGLAGVVKGMKIASVKKYSILSSLNAMIKEKRGHARQGALFAYEALFEALGKLFEPYLAQLIPDLLLCFGDSVSEVRIATQEATRAIMSNITAFGVKMILPLILKALDDIHWRTKLESIGMLGAMAFCAPRQLCAFLPTVVPRLMSVLADPHPKVQEAAKSALRDIGAVIRNPEIQELVPQLLQALTDPSVYTRDALQKLMDTSFVNSVDAPSLALIVPILNRGLRDRSPTVKRMAALIAGTMCEFLRDISAALPYTQVLLEDLQRVLVDPIPDVRSAGARALGLLFRGVGEGHFPNLIDWLFELLRSNSSSVERNGGAQGLAEVLTARGLSSLRDHLPRMLEAARDSEATVREAFFEVWVYLPKAMGEGLATNLDEIMPCIMCGLADEKESVRSMALSAGKAIVTLYGPGHYSVLLQIFQAGLRSQSWRVRELSCVLLGDVLARVAGVEVSIVADDHIEFDIDDQRKPEYEAKVVSALGRDQRDRIFANLFIVQADSVHNVQQTAWLVWKSMVSNSNRMLGEIMPVLMEYVIASLADNDAERRASAGRSLGAMVQRSGDIVLPVIIPIFQEGLRSKQASVRQGVCQGMSEVMLNANKDHITGFMADLVPSIRSALCDENDTVRSAAARSFETLFRNIGPRAVADVVPPLVQQLLDASSSTVETQRVLAGLRQILLVRSGPVMQHLIPALVGQPIAPFPARALASLADVYGPGIDMHIASILPWFVNGVSNSGSEGDRETLMSSATTFVLAVHPDATHSLVQSLCGVIDDTRKQTSSGSQARKLTAATLLGAYASGTSADYSAELESVLGALLSLFSSTDPELLSSSTSALSSVVVASAKEDLVVHLAFIRNTVMRLGRECGRKSRTDVVTVPGLCVANGLSPLLNVCQFGLLNGLAPQRQLAATTIGDLVSVTTPEALRPFVIKITGPLIRIVGDRFPAGVKAAILTTLGLLLKKSGPSMKPFVPQLQATFVKNLRDPDVSVRDSAGAALASLMTLAPNKVDALVNELLGQMSTETSASMTCTLAKALLGLLDSVGKSIGADLYSPIEVSLRDLLKADHEETREVAARACGALSVIVPDGHVHALFDACSQADLSASWEWRHGATLAAAFMIASGASVDNEDATQLARERLRDSDAAVRCAALHCASGLVASQVPASAMLMSAMIDLSRDHDADVRREFAFRVEQVARRSESRSAAIPCAQVLVGMVGDGNTSVSLAAQSALAHLLQLHKGRSGLDAIKAGVDSATALALEKFANRPTSRTFVKSTNSA
ncbi:unnamed protein product (mitochondrion) [Plasmodiophora brassicae]|uniref:TOG domain-containing protein n=1 Tax=Plasmodiophora brassicae TaxID=37360 RepID=A0A0G4ISY1_PLABS|nr:hypothetical protein PBRA_006489 [Plasmodiophora brassicae]SPQ94461.1 unnamed protein product [Plasmodiophora brassicae]